MIGAVVYGVALAALVFLPLNPDPFWYFLWERFGIDYSPQRDRLADVAVNVLLFVPIGVLARVAWRAKGVARPGRRALVTCVAIGIGIELVQWGLGWRTASIQDAVCNTLGGAAGIGLARLFARRPSNAPGASA